jgi:hypothetical protein
MPTNNDDRITAAISQHALDRLVDGELDADERRALLTGLTAEPDGWQRCALAFLEAQSWRKACRQIAVQPDETPPAAQRIVSPRQIRRPPLALAAAAVLALVFAGGLAVGRSWTILAPGSSPQIADRNGGSSTQGETGATAKAAANAREHGDGQKDQLVVHVLGFINVDGEDGARHAVPILAAPGLKVEPPRHSSTVAATGSSDRARREELAGRRSAGVGKSDVADGGRPRGVLTAVTSRR